MKKVLCTLTFFSFIFLSLLSSAQKSPKRELRGAWVTTHLNLDWPFSSAHTVARQKDSLIAILDQHKATGMNTIFFQVRSQSDALYPSTIEPWAAVLTGVQGRNPGWDPLQFAIDECRKRGMELHAWINPYRAVANTNNLPNFAANHIAKTQPGWMLTQGVEQILNPGLPEVRNYLMQVFSDILTRYDVDGLHFDDYFYIAPSSTIAPYNDDATYASYPNGFPNTTAGRADWRRDNVNQLIKRVYDTIRMLKPWVKFGVSPSGIYRSSTNAAIGSNTSSGAFQHYSAIYADSKRWLQEGWVDYIAPQVYWFMGQTGSDYNILIPWWNNQAAGRHIYIGQAIYKVNDPAQGANWANRSQIPNQMRMNRQAQYPNVYGEIGFRTRFLRNNPLNVRDSIRTRIYVRPALPPLMPWVDASAPLPPTELVAEKQAGSYVLNWNKPGATTEEMDKVRQFVIYRSESPVININDTANLLFITPTDVTTYTDNTIDADKTYYYVVTSVDRLANESSPSNVTDYQPPVISCPATQLLTLAGNCSATMPDYRNMAVVSDDVTPESGITVVQVPAAGTVVYSPGNITVTLTATDAAGKSTDCSFTVTKEDKTAPTITALQPGVTQGSTTTVAMDAGTCGFTASTQFDIQVTDECDAQPVVSYTLSYGGITGSPVVANSLQGAVLGKGVTTVNWTVQDASGNTAQYSYSIDVTDTEVPVISCPADMTVNPTSLEGAVVHYTIPEGTDNCSGATTTKIAGPDSGDLFAIGTTTITYQVTDAAGNSTQCSFTITVRDPYCEKYKSYRKVFICHNGNTQCVSVRSLNMHLSMGAQLGRCEWYTDNSIVQTKKAAAGTEVPGNSLKVLPNPVRGRMQVQYVLAESGKVQIEVVDVTGRKVGLLQRGVQEAGSYMVDYDATKLVSGVYYCRIIIERAGNRIVQVSRIVKID